MKKLVDIKILIRFFLNIVYDFKHIWHKGTKDKVEIKLQIIRVNKNQIVCIQFMHAIQVLKLASRFLYVTHPCVHVKTEV